MMTLRWLVVLSTAVGSGNGANMKGNVSTYNSSCVTSIQVNYGKAAGMFDFIHGVDHGPECDPQCLHWLPGGTCNESVTANAATELLSFGASVIRTHDSGVLDWPIIFPHSLSLTDGAETADTTDASNYVWAAADEYYGKIIDSGLEPYFRLGTSWGQLGGGLPPPDVPYNQTALVDVLLHIVMHYNAGWGGGRNFSGMRTQFWEIWNEPDGGDGRFWNRTATEFQELVGATITAIKQYDSSLTVGTDGSAGVEPRPGSNGSQPYSWGLMKYLAERKVDFDFFSWHAYGWPTLRDNSQLYTDWALDVRLHLDALGLQNVKQHVTEWFPCILCPMQDTAQGAAYFAGGFAKMIDAGVSLATAYPLCSNDEGNKTGGKGWGVFDPQSSPGKLLWRPLTHCYSQFGELMQLTPLRIEAMLQPRDSGTDVLAGVAPACAEDGTTRLRMLLALQHSNCTAVESKISGLPTGATVRYSVSIIDNNHSEPGVIKGGVAKIDANGMLNLALEVTAPAVLFFRVDSEQLRESNLP